jgi:hypothetical protein
VSLVIKRYNDLSAPHLFTFPDGTVESLRFSPSKWEWLRETPLGLAHVDGVTTVLKSVDGTALDPLINWSIKQGFDKFKRLMMAHLGPNGALELWEEELDAIISAGKKGAREKLEDAGMCGSMAHAHLERIAKATLAGDAHRLEELVALLPPDPRAESCVIAGIVWCVEHDIEWIHSEVPVYSRIHNVCGTMDNLAWASSCGRPECCPTPFKRRRVQVDYKSSNGLRGWSYCCQTGIYTMCWEEEFPDQPIDDRFVLMLDKMTAEFEAYHLEGRALQEQDSNAYLDALRCYRSHRIVQARMDAVVDERRAVATAAKAAAKDAEREARLALACEGSKRYKGVRYPRCNDEHPCKSCLKIYVDKHPAV